MVRQKPIYGGIYVKSSIITRIYKGQPNVKILNRGRMEDAMRGVSSRLVR